MPIAIISQGEEILTGETIDTNSAWLADAAWGVGTSVSRMVTVGDTREAIEWALTTAAESAAVIICTGGLGPTEDDLTAEAVAAWAGVVCEERPEAMAQIEARYARMDRVMNDTNRKQALLPQGAELLENRWGTAPGFSMHHDGATVYCLPGIPREMRAMFDAHVRPRLPGSERSLRRIRTFGISESRLQAIVGDLDTDPAVVGFRAHLPEVIVKLRFDSDIEDEHQDEIVAKVVHAIGDAVYCVDGGDLAEEAGAALLGRKETVSMAESCTAGGVSAWMCRVPGASAYFDGGAIVYSNAAKVRDCGVDPQTIEEQGAVSGPVARQLAEGIRSRCDTTWGVGITGIAGPSGGSPDKPVGTVHVAVAGPDGVSHRQVRLPGDRIQVTTRAAGVALHMLLNRLRQP